MIPVSANFKTRRKSGQYRLEQLYEMFLPVNPVSVSVSSSTAGYPASAVIDGDRTHINAGPATGLYPPPAGPENYIGGGMWKASAAVPQSVTLETGGASIGMVRLSTHPTEGGIKSFKLQTSASLGGPYTDVTGILRAEAWEKWNGSSRYLAGAFYYQDFERLALGDLNGQDSWVKVAGDPIYSFRVENTDVLNGVYSLAANVTSLSGGTEAVYRRMLTIPSSYTATALIRPLFSSSAPLDFGAYNSDVWIVPPAWKVRVTTPGGTPTVSLFLNNALTPIYSQPITSVAHTLGVQVNGTAIGLLVDGSVVYSNTFTPGSMDRIMIHFSPGATLGFNGIMDDLLFQSTGNGIITVAPSNVPMSSIPSVVEVVLDPSSTSAFLRVLVLDVGPTPGNDGLARLCECECFTRVDVTSRLSGLDAAHQTDIRMQGINARQGNAELKNQDLTFTPASFQRPTTGQCSVDAVPELYVWWGIDGELVRVATMAVDEAQFDHIHRTVGLRIRGRSERRMFDRLIGAYRTSVDLDAAVELAWNLCNLQSGLLATGRNPQVIPYFIPNQAGRNELEDLRKASVDRGVFVKGDGTLGAMTSTFASDMPWTTTNTNPGHCGFPYLMAYRQDALFFDPVNPYLLVMAERTFQTFGGSANLIDTDADRLSVWDVRQPVSTRTLLCQVFNRANATPTKGYLDHIFAVPSVMARRPGTNDFYFLTGGAYPQVGFFQGPSGSWNLQDAQPPWRMSAYTIANGVATPIFVNNVISHNAECACFVGNFLYWWDAPPFTVDVGGFIHTSDPRNARLWRWDVTTAFATAAIVGTLAFPVHQVGGMVAVGTKLYWTENGIQDGRIAVWDSATFPTFAPATFAKPYGASVVYPALPSPFQIVTDGVSLWGTGQGTPDPGNPSVDYKQKLWRVDLATATVSLSGDIATAAGAIIVTGGVALTMSTSGFGYLGLQSWDGVDGHSTKLINVSTVIDTTSYIHVAHKALAISSATILGKQILTAWGNGIGSFVIHSNPGGGSYSVGEAGTGIANFTLWSYKPAASAVADAITGDQVLDVSENISYELGGANAVVNAVDGQVITRTVASGAVANDTLGNPNDHLILLSDTVDPTSLTGPFTRRHARIPLGKGGAYNGNVPTDTSVDFRLPAQSANLSQDPTFFNVVALAGKYFISPPLAYNASLRILGDGSQALRWPTIEVPAYPEVELNDELTVTIVQLSNATPLSITGRYRVTMVHHKVTVSESGAEARTSLELVSIP